MSVDRDAVIVTGSSGLMGQPVCRQLAEAGYDVYGFDRVGLPEPPKTHERVRDIECDISDSASVRAAMSKVHRLTDGRLASVVHMAAYYDFSGEDSDLYRKVTIEGTDRLLNELEDFRYEQFIFTSTMLVHEPCEVGDHVSEEDTLKGKWAYPQSKISTEKLIRDGHPNARSVFLRIAGVYTDYGRQPTLVQQLKRVYEKDLQSHFFPGDQDAGQSMVHLDDAVDAVLRTVERRRTIAPKTAILIGEPEPVSYGELQDLAGEALHGSEWTTVCVPKSLAKAGAGMINTVQGDSAFIKPFMIDMADDHYALDISRAHELLGWQPKHSLAETVGKMASSLKSDPEAWYRKNGLS